MSDRELLELAAKAAGYTKLKKDIFGFHRVIGEHEDGLLCMVEWNPLTDDGDALRLAVKLGLDVRTGLYTNTIVVDSFEIEDAIEIVYEDDPYAATRRAIVIAAAEIGKNL